MEKNVWKKVLSASIALAFVSGGISSQLADDADKHRLRASAVENEKAESYKITIRQDDHGTIKTVKYGSKTETSSRKAGDYVDINVYPDEGYYLSGMDSSEPDLKWYYDDTYSLGFKMPSDEIILYPTFSKIPEGADKIPEGRLYYEVPVYKDGKRSSERLYIPINTTVMKDPVENMPFISVSSDSGVELIRGKQYDLQLKEDQTSDGTMVSATFTGLGGPKTDSKGYVAYLADPVYGTAEVSLLLKSEKKLSEGSNEGVELNSEYELTVKKDGTYSFEFGNEDTLSLKVFIKSEDGKFEKTVTTRGEFKIDLKAGTKYTFNAKTDYNPYQYKDLDLFIGKYSANRIMVTSRYGSVKLISENGDEITSAYENDIVYVYVQPQEGYEVDSIKVTQVDKSTLELYEGAGNYSFKMPKTAAAVEVSYKEASSGHNVTVKGEDHGKVIVSHGDKLLSAGEKILPGDFLDLTFEPDEGYYFEGLRMIESGSDTKSFNPGNTFRYLMLDRDVVFEAVFSPIPDEDRYKIEWSQSIENGKFSVTEYGSNGTKDKTSCRAGGYLEFNISPDDGYFLSAVNVNAGSCEVEYYDDSDSFGFYMPKNNVYVGRTFLELSKADKTKPSNGLYREVWEYKDGKKTGKKFYLPISVKSNIPDNGVLPAGQTPTFIFDDIDNYVGVTIDKQVGLTDKTEVLSNGQIKHTVTIKGLGQFRGEGIYKGQTVFTYTEERSSDKTPTTVPEGTVTPAPTVTTAPATKPVAGDDLTVTTGTAKSQGYTDYATGKNVYCIDFTLNNAGGVKIKGGKLELEFDAPIASFMYGADIGNKMVTIDPSNPNKLIIEFTTYDSNGVTTGLSSTISFSADAKGDINCTSAKVVSVSK